MPAQFVPLAERIVDALLDFSPDIARFAGDHRYDDRLPDFSPGAVARDVDMLREASAALSQVDDDELHPQERVDHAILLATVERELFEYTEIREHEWNPLVHNPGPLLYALIARPFAPPDQRLVSLAGRLDAIPDALATARAVLVDCPRIHLETAVGQFAGTASLIRHQVPELLAEAPVLAGRVTAAGDQAIAALAEFGGWLRDRLADEKPGRDPRLGRPLWEARLWHTLDTELTAAEVLSRAWATLDRVGGELRESAAQFLGALGFSGTFVEGWAVYAEELMARYGFGGVPVRLQQLKMQLRMALNAVLDQLVHCDGLAEADAMALMTGRAFQEEGEAAGKWRRALLTSTQLSTYFVGYSEVAEISRARPAEVRLQEWHDAMLAHGSPPPRHVRNLLAV